MSRDQGIECGDRMVSCLFNVAFSILNVLQHGQLVPRMSPTTMHYDILKNVWGIPLYTPYVLEFLLILITFVTYKKEIDIRKIIDPDDVCKGL
jgi:hypothetical protein